MVRACRRCRPTADALDVLLGLRYVLTALEGILVLVIALANGLGSLRSCASVFRRVLRLRRALAAVAFWPCSSSLPVRAAQSDGRPSG